MKDVVLRWRVHTDAEQVVAAAVAEIASSAEQAVAERGAFVIALSGGSTPYAIYRSARGLVSPWSRWHVYFTDERCLPVDHAERNDTMARAVWLDHVPIPRAQVHAIPAELGAEAGAAAYRDELEGIGRFDLVLLGLGEDGHTASLFPGHPAGAEPGSPAALAVHAAPKPPAERISLSAARLADADAVELIVLGEHKRAAVRRLRAGADLPILAVKPPKGIDVLLDAAADA